VANDDNKSPEAHLAMKIRMGQRDGSGSMRTAVTSLQVMAKTVVPGSWATPTTRDHKDTGDLSQSMTRRDGKARNDTNGRLAFGVTPTGSPAGTEKLGALNPALSRWLMGYYPVWCDAAILRPLPFRRF
jgi:hypothetical protein